MGRTALHLQQPTRVATTYRDQLASVNAAIAAIEGGAQQYTNGAQQLTRGNLAELYRERARLTPLALREERGGGLRVSYIR